MAKADLGISGARVVIGIDPGLQATGFAVLEVGGSTLKLLEFGDIKTSPKQALCERLGTIFTGLEGVMERWHPHAMVLEKLYSNYSFPNTAIVMGHVRGVICLAAYRANAELMEVAATEAKRALTGYGRASKEQMAASISRLLGLKDIPKSEHTADALALATVGAFRVTSPMARR